MHQNGNVQLHALGIDVPHQGFVVGAELLISRMELQPLAAQFLDRPLDFPQSRRPHVGIHPGKGNEQVGILFGVQGQVVVGQGAAPLIIGNHIDDDRLVNAGFLKGFVGFVDGDELLAVMGSLRAAPEKVVVGFGVGRPMPQAGLLGKGMDVDVNGLDRRRNHNCPLLSPAD